MVERKAWKDDFPISWVDDHFVTRREFTKSLVLVSCATFCATGVIAVMGRAGAAAAAKCEPRRIAAVGEIRVGSSRVFEFPAPGDPCLLIRLTEERFVAFGQRCTHLGCPVLYRKETRKLHCPCHEGYFNAEDGSVVAGPPPRPLPRVEIERRGDELWATGFRA
ncbi:MAG TPA: Rieske (2Fe-2S) protein [Planctomycetota bacterium]|nr:Rieske (2Fe-2S) protein [Planctomycetota bacterium]